MESEARKKFRTEVPRRRIWEPETDHSQFFEAILSARIVDRWLPFRVCADGWSGFRCASGGGGGPADHVDSSVGLGVAASGSHPNSRSERLLISPKSVRK